MRWAARISLVFLVSLAVYTAWPFVDLYRLARAIERRDVVALSERVEFRAVRTSVNRQVVAAYLRLTGKEARLGPFSDVAVGLAVAMADPAMADVASAEKLLELFTKGWPQAVPASSQSPDAAGPAIVLPRNPAALWQLYAGSEYRFNDFYVFLPPDVPAAQRFRLQLRLTQWTWKLNDVQLPADLRVQLAQELIRASERK